MFYMKRFQSIPQFIHQRFETIIRYFLSKLTIGTTEKHEQDRMPFEKFRAGEAHDFGTFHTARCGFHDR
ncbi:hypothetical protein AR158_C544R [Paramecium bursaria Chlorella virus AR158]|uniref:hypothetical protein n=1 Tax=Paramecium bursaria Chlorella virus AR158 TaxID=380598 RepID=UPI00015AA75D|nr:hypothetical protein AR158_C544R [Paramecium bursaria Chlorella virus AR158]ABU44089.1 hypothetical protein AR158_C544R [Paramecium bursaria Chlorella virus AR158]